MVLAVAQCPPAIRNVVFRMTVSAHIFCMPKILPDQYKKNKLIDNAVNFNRK